MPRRPTLIERLGYEMRDAEITLFCREFLEYIRNSDKIKINTNDLYFEKVADGGIKIEDDLFLIEDGIYSMR